MGNNGKLRETSEAPATELCGHGGLAKKYTYSWSGTRTRDPGIMSSGVPREEKAKLGQTRNVAFHNAPRQCTTFSAASGAKASRSWSCVGRPPPLTAASTVHVSNRAVRTT